MQWASIFQLSNKKYVIFKFSVSFRKGFLGRKKNRFPVLDSIDSGPDWTSYAEVEFSSNQRLSFSKGWGGVEGLNFYMGDSTPGLVPVPNFSLLDASPRILQARSQPSEDILSEWGQGTLSIIAQQWISAFCSNFEAILRWVVRIYTVIPSGLPAPWTSCA